MKNIFCLAAAFVILSIQTAMASGPFDAHSGVLGRHAEAAAPAAPKVEAREETLDASALRMAKGSKQEQAGEDQALREAARTLKSGELAGIAASETTGLEDVEVLGAIEKEKGERASAKRRAPIAAKDRGAGMAVYSEPSGISDVEYFPSRRRHQ